MTDSKIRSARRVLSQGAPPREFVASLGVSTPTLYRWVPARDPEAVAVPLLGLGADGC
ncbi:MULTISPECIES: hypothetical protein [Arthrobacter]|uniref:hypothetical protein n=1 Tax=Arthrobacter TaxID=1663 RepID=UPI000AB68BF8|nr:MULTISPECIES: hypothetical protein [Arthrobacter]